MSGLKVEDIRQAKVEERNPKLFRRPQMMGKPEKKRMIVT